MDEKKKRRESVWMKKKKERECVDEKKRERVCG